MIFAGLLHKGRGETRHVTPFIASVCKWPAPTLTTKTKTATTETTTTTTMVVYIPVDGYSSSKRLL